VREANVGSLVWVWRMPWHTYIRALACHMRVSHVRPANVRSVRCWRGVAVANGDKTIEIDYCGPHAGGKAKYTSNKKILKSERSTHRDSQSHASSRTLPFLSPL
jgi:hypothetical protein